jgi:hypothetical protein
MHASCMILYGSFRHKRTLGFLRERIDFIGQFQKFIRL